LAGVLESARESRNLYLDTSSSNSWMQQAPEFTDLETVFGKILEEKAFGPERLLFGSDSTVFPRGWRTDIHRTQRAVLDRLGVSSRERQLVFSRNLERLLEPAGGATRPTA
jgi:predicted TIM-barrel fold metal-dependent hydrolase